MSVYGFVYVLGNESMPGIFKIGCTERSPMQRASELSNSTGMPTKFDVICFWQGKYFFEFERDLHDYFESCRINTSREFFKCPLEHLIEQLQSRWADVEHLFHKTKFTEAYLSREEGNG